MSTSRLARGAGLLSIVLLMLGAYGCDQLGMGGKTETKKDTAKADKDDDAEDDDDKDKKKKKKKKSKDEEDEEDEKEADAKDAKEKPATTVADVPTPPPVAAPAATVASGGSTGNATCDAYLKGMDCLMGKMPPQAQASFAQSKAQMEQVFKQLGSNAETACKSALDAVQPSLAQYGCGTGGATAATPPPTPTPLPPTAPTPPATTGGGNSPVPSVADWDGVTNEVTVRGSSALNCETKMLREWVRVSCRGKNSTGGTPTTVNITSGGGRGNEFVFASAGVTSLVVRFVQGVDLKADFGWTDGSYNLHVWWPRGAPEPPAKGVFTRN